MFQSMLVIAKARWRITVNTLWRGRIGRKIAIVAVLLALGVLAFWFYWLIGAAIRGLSSPEFAQIVQETIDAAPPGQFQDTNVTAIVDAYLDALPSLVLFAALFVLVFSSFSTVLSSLYLSGDIDSLLVAPVPTRAVFTVKFFEGLITPYAILFLLLGPLLLGYGLGLGFGPLYYLCAILALLLLPLLPFSLGALLVMAVVRVIPARRAREIVGVIGGLIGVSWYVASQFSPEIAPRLADLSTLDALTRLDVPLLPTAWAGRALVAAGEGAWLTLLVYGGLFAGISIGAFAGCLLLVEQLFYAGWSNMATQGGRVNGNRRSSERSREAAGPLRRLFGFLPHGSRAILLKDLRVFPRDLRNLQALIFPLAFAGIWSFQLLRNPPPTASSAANPFTALAGLASIGIAFYASVTLASAIGGTGISREGRGYWILQTAPLSGWQIILGKFALAYLPFPLIGLPLAALLGLLQRSSPLGILGAIGMLLISGIGSTAISQGLGAAFPRLNWENPNQQTSLQAGCLTPILYLLYLGLAIGSAGILPGLGQFWPALGSIFAIIGWAILLILTTAVTWGALAFGANRLEKLEIT